jgi:hypothetical protein
MRRPALVAANSRNLSHIADPSLPFMITPRRRPVCLYYTTLVCVRAYLTALTDSAVDSQSFSERASSLRGRRCEDRSKAAVGDEGKEDSFLPGPRFNQHSMDSLFLANFNKCN